MQHVEGLDEVEYLGGDVSPSLVAANAEQHGQPKRRFIRFDISADPFPEADVWFCRDCLFHLPYAAILASFENFARSRIPLLLLTNHPNHTGFRNHDIEAGHRFRPSEFRAPPFSLPRSRHFAIADWVFPFPEREMRLWTREEVEASLPAIREVVTLATAKGED